MSKIIEFKKQEEVCECPFCGLVEDYIDLVADSESYDELRAILKGLVTDANDLAIYHFVSQEVEQKIQLLDCINGTCDCEDECDLDDELD